MYGALWRVLPGPVWIKLLILLVLFAALLFCLVEWVFPLVNDMIPTREVTVEG